MQVLMSPLAPADPSIKYACERCKDVRSLPPPKGSPGLLPSMRIRFGTIGRRAERVQRMQEYVARADEAAHQKFTGSFRFCHECRRFVCPKCWNRTWRTCKSCVAKAFQNLSPRRRRFHYGLSVTVIGASLMLLVLGIGSALAVGAVSSPSTGGSGSYTVSCAPPAGKAPLNVACAVNPADSADVIWTVDGVDSPPPYVLTPGHHVISARIKHDGQWVQANQVQIDVS